MSELDFDITLIPLKQQLETGIFNCGDSFDLKIKIISPKNENISYRKITFQFLTIIEDEKLRIKKIATHADLEIAKSGQLNPDFEYLIPHLTIPLDIQTYHGELFSIKHILQFNVKKTFKSFDYTEEIKAFQYTPCVDKLQPLCVRVAVSENVRIDLLIGRRKFELRDVILGGAHFLLVALKITKFEVSLVAQELIEDKGKSEKHKNVIHTWGITDGAPIKGEIIPFRLYLSPLNLTPSFVDQQKGYSVSHFLHFTIFTTSGQKYFKSLQIKLGKWTSMPFQFLDEF